jgi:hypothetical protein
MNKWNQKTSVPVVTPPAASYYGEKEFLYRYLAGLLLPLGQATVTAAMAFIVTWVLFYTFNAIDVWKPALIVFVITWAGTWVYLMWRWLNITAALERATGIDMNGDGVIGAERKKPSQPLVIRLDDVRNGNYRSRQIELDVTEAQLEEFARGSLNGTPFTERQWTGKGKPFSSGQDGTFRPFRKEWLRQGLVEVVSDKDNRQGFDFTDEGWAMLEKLAGSPPAAKAASPQMRTSAEFGGKDDGPDLTDEQMEAIEKENAAYADKYQS